MKNLFFTFALAGLTIATFVLTKSKILSAFVLFGIPLLWLTWAIRKNNRENPPIPLSRPESYETARSSNDLSHDRDGLSFYEARTYAKDSRVGSTDHPTRIPWGTITALIIDFPQDSSEQHLKTSFWSNEANLYLPFGPKQNPQELLSITQKALRQFRLGAAHEVSQLPIGERQVQFANLCAGTDAATLTQLANSDPEAFATYYDATVEANPRPAYPQVGDWMDDPRAETPNSLAYRGMLFAIDQQRALIALDWTAEGSEGVAALSHLFEHHNIDPIEPDELAKLHEATPLENGTDLMFVDVADQLAELALDRGKALIYINDQSDWYLLTLIDAQHLPSWDGQAIGPDDRMVTSSIH